MHNPGATGQAGTKEAADCLPDQYENYSKNLMRRLFVGNNGKVAIVTGASRGIGLAIAGRLNETELPW